MYEFRSYLHKPKDPKSQSIKRGEEYIIAVSKKPPVSANERTSTWCAVQSDPTEAIAFRSRDALQAHDDKYGHATEYRVFLTRLVTWLD